MNFVEAVEEADKGKKIRLPEWDEDMCLLKYGLLLVWDKTWGTYTPTVLSILRDDWEVVK